MPLPKRSALGGAGADTTLERTICFISGLSAAALPAAWGNKSWVVVVVMAAQAGIAMVGRKLGAFAPGAFPSSPGSRRKRVGLASMLTNSRPPSSCLAMALSAAVANRLARSQKSGRADFGT